MAPFDVSGRKELNELWQCQDRSEHVIVWPDSLESMTSCIFKLYSSALAPKHKTEPINKKEIKKIQLTATVSDVCHVAWGWWHVCSHFWPPFLCDFVIQLNLLTYAEEMYNIYTDTADMYMYCSTQILEFISCSGYVWGHWNMGSNIVTSFCPH